jgi:hypothetical protein
MGKLRAKKELRARYRLSPIGRAYRTYWKLRDEAAELGVPVGSTWGLTELRAQVRIARERREMVDILRKNRETTPWVPEAMTKVAMMAREEHRFLGRTLAPVTTTLVVTTWAFWRSHVRPGLLRWHRGARDGVDRVTVKRRDMEMTWQVVDRAERMLGFHRAYVVWAGPWWELGDVEEIRRRERMLAAEMGLTTQTVQINDYREPGPMAIVADEEAPVTPGLWKRLARKWGIR